MNDRLPGPEHFSSMGAPLGTHGLTIALRDIVIRISGLSFDIHQKVRGRYSLFLAQRKPIHTVTLYAGEGTYLNESSDGYVQLEEIVCDSGHILLSTDFAAFKGRNETTGALRISSPEDVPTVLRALENYLRWVVADLSMDRGGFVLHAAGIVRDSRAFIFFGHSGAGKSTIAELSQGHQILSDDLVILFKTDQGFSATTTPFWGAYPQACKDTGLYPVAGVFQLYQSDRTDVVRLAKAPAAGLILSCCPFVSDPARRAHNLLNLIGDLCRALPVYRLEFCNDKAFWNRILQLPVQPSGVRNKSAPRKDQ